MNHSMINASVSLHALQQKLDLISNNVANLKTTGYKRSDASFQDVLTSVATQPSTFKQDGRMTPLGYNQGWGAKLGSPSLDMTQGSLLPTERPLDLGLQGPGLFEISTVTLDAEGNPVEQVRWTRDGSFELSPNPADPDNLYLATKDGYYVMGTDNAPIGVPKNQRMTIREDGTVVAYNDNDPNAEPVEVGQIKLVRAIRPQLLQQVGDNLYSLPEDVTDQNREQILQTVNAENNEVNSIAIRQGFLEQSNVVLGDEMTEIMTLQRAYQLNAKAISSADQMMGITTNLRG